MNDRPVMTIAVDWDVKQQNKQNFLAVIYRKIVLVAFLLPVSIYGSFVNF